MTKTKENSSTAVFKGSVRVPVSDCEIVRSKRKTLQLQVKPHRVIVRCPMDAPEDEVRAFVHRHKRWVERRLAEESQKEKERLRVEPGGVIFYQARELAVVFREGREQRILAQGGQFIIQGHQLTPAKAQEQLREWLMAQAREYLIPRANGLARHLGVDHKVTEIRLRKTKSKWGHCTSEGVLQYNWLIMLAPYSIIDYMISHEVCHLIHLNHSRRFWKLVGSVCPDYKQYEDWLNKHEHRFWF